MHQLLTRHCHGFHIDQTSTPAMIFHSDEQGFQNSNYAIATQPGIAVDRFAREIGCNLTLTPGALAATECQTVGPPHLLPHQGRDIISSMIEPLDITVATSTSLISFEKAGGGQWPIWDRFLTIDGKRAYHIGNICETCA